MSPTRPFRGFRFPPEVVLRAVRWHLRFTVDFRGLEGMLAERGVRVDRVSLHRWVRRFAPEVERRVRPHPRPAAGRAWRVDRTCIRATSPPKIRPRNVLGRSGGGACRG